MTPFATASSHSTNPVGAARGRSKIGALSLQAYLAISSKSRSGYVCNDTYGMYDGGMKTITITIPDDLDAEAATEAKRRGISKSELIRRGLAAVLPEQDVELAEDPWHRLAGFASPDVSVEAGEIDRVVYDS